MPSRWTVSVSQMNEHIARLVFAPAGAEVGPTFAVQRAEFANVAIPESGEVVVCGGQVAIKVANDGQAPHPENLEIRWQRAGGQRAWRPGDLDEENLGAPFLALDNLWRDYIPRGVQAVDPLVGFDRYVWNTAVLTMEMEAALTEVIGKAPDTDQRNDEVRRLIEGEQSDVLKAWPERVLAAQKAVSSSPPGLLTRSGLTIFRDDTPPWDTSTEWIGQRQDPEPFILYLVYHDCDWKLAVRELTFLLGAIPRIPPFLLGIWYSNYSELGQQDFERVVADFARHDLPLSLISVDMDWHGKEWYGYSWNAKMFPEPARFASWLKEQDLKATFNIHPLYVRPSEPRAEEFIAQAGHDGRILGDRGDWHPLQAGSMKVDIHDRRQADAYLSVLHRDIEDGGCDFWWIDGSVKKADGRDECSWLNHVYRQHLARREGHTPIVLARAGGLGAHRDAMLFSGDACSQWEVLAFEVETIVRAAGALMAYVSHDIGGFYSDAKERPTNQPPDDLYLRWVQLGCLGPIMRLHSFDGVREPWRFTPQSLEISRRFMNLRTRLLPYLDALAAEAHQTGVVPARPMWFEFDRAESYECLGQYMLGDALLVAPVASEDSKARYWLPDGLWHDAFSTRTETGPTWIEESVPLDVMPLWVRDGFAVTLGEVAARPSQVLAGPRHRITGGGWAS